MAQLYLAREQGPNGRKVALKQILPHLVEDPSFLSMFLDEARIAARLHHPNVVEIYDLGKEGDALFIAMEFIHGEDLRRIQKRAHESERPLPIPLACRIVRDAAAGLDYAHRRADAQGKSLGIVHRDVSPQNILVAFDGGVKVVDFGVAKAADKATVTASGVIKGKHPYMSPEQALGQEDLDCRTDVFALGVVLYEAVTGIRLFRRATDLQTLQAVAECSVVPPSKVAPGISLQLDELLMTALTRERERRYPSCTELGAALDAVLATQADSSSAAVGHFVSELFADRRQRESRSQPKPTFGVPAADPQPDTPATPAGFDKAKTIELASGPIPAFDPASVRPTDDARGRLSSTAVETKAERPSEKLAALVGNETLPARPPGFVDNTTLPPGSSGIGITEPQQPSPFAGAHTVPFGKAAAPTGTAQYGAAVRMPLQTITALTGRHDADDEQTLDTRTHSNEAMFKTKIETRRSSAPALIALATLVPLLGAGYYAFTTLNAPAPPAAQPAPPAPTVQAAPAAVPKVAPEAAPSAPKAQPLGVVSDCESAVPLTVTDGRLFLKDGAQLKPGTGFRLVGEGSETRDYFGMAMVVEVKDGAARLIADEPQRLPEKLYACPAEEELPLKGTLHTRSGSTNLGFENSTDFDWTECEVYLPNNTQARLPARTALKPGKLSWVNGVHATPRRVGAEPKLRGNSARIRCAEGDGELSVSEEK
jgi:serine/threonine protein kinase